MQFRVLRPGGARHPDRRANEVCQLSLATSAVISPLVVLAIHDSPKCLVLGANRVTGSVQGHLIPGIAEVVGRLPP